MVDRQCYRGPLKIPNDAFVWTDEIYEHIFNKTGVSCKVRFRERWGDQRVSLIGPGAKIDEAEDLVMEVVADPCKFGFSQQKADKRKDLFDEKNPQASSKAKAKTSPPEAVQAPLPPPPPNMAPNMYGGMD